MKITRKSLLDLLSEESPTNLFAQLKMRMEEIKEAKKRGFSNHQIISALKKDGLEISHPTFRSYLSRYNSNDANDKIQSEEYIPAGNTEDTENKIPEAKKNHITPSKSKTHDAIRKIRLSHQNLESFEKLFEEIQ